MVTWYTAVIVDVKHGEFRPQDVAKSVLQLIAAGLENASIGIRYTTTAILICSSQMVSYLMHGNHSINTLSVVKQYLYKSMPVLV